MRRVLLSLVAAVFLAGCTLPFIGGATEPTVEPPTATVEQSEQPLVPTEPSLLATPTLSAEMGDEVTIELTPDITGEIGGGDIIPGTALAGEIIFVRDGQVWAVGIDGSNERQLTAAAQGAMVTELTLSPDGHFLAFITDSQSVVVIDLEMGSSTIIDQAAGGVIDSLVWSADSLLLYYHKLVFDPQSFVPTTSQLWQAPMPPGTLPNMVTESALSSGGSVVPRFGLMGGRLIIQQFSRGDEAGQLFLFDTSAEIITPLVEGFGAWDVSPDGSRMLLFSQAPGDGSLYLADLTADGVSNIRRITPADFPGAFTGARFDPNGESFVAFLNSPSAARQLVWVRATETGSYQIIGLGGGNTSQSVDFSWYIGPGVVVQRIFPDTGESTLWLLPLDGSTGTLITSGESPRVVSGR